MVYVYDRYKFETNSVSRYVRAPNKSLIQKKTANLYIFQIDFDNEKSVDLDLKSCMILDF